MPSIITEIVTEAKTVWADIAATIENDAAKVQAALPSSALPGFAATVEAVKQGASDALGAVESGLTGAEPDLVKAVEVALDGWLAASTNGMTVALNPLINAGMTGGANLATNAVAAWLLRNQAAMAPPLPPRPVAAAVTGQ